MDGECIAWILFKTPITMKELNRKIFNVLVSVPDDGYNSVNISCFKVFVLRINNCMNFALLQQKILKQFSVVCGKPRIFSDKDVVPLCVQ